MLKTDIIFEETIIKSYPFHMTNLHEGLIITIDNFDFKVKSYSYDNYSTDDMWLKIIVTK